MSSAVAQRRGKNVKGSTKKKNNNEKKKQSVEEQLNKAEAIVSTGKARTHQLHIWWRKYMFGMSFMILFFALSQIKKPINECVESLKAIDSEIIPYSLLETGLIIGKNAICEMFGLLTIGFLSSFVSQNRFRSGRFDHISFICATLLVPFSLLAFFNKRTTACDHNYLFSSSLQIDEDSTEESEEDRPFPLSIVFYVIVTTSSYFMLRQMKARDRDVTAVRDMRNELVEAQIAAKNGGKKSSNANEKKEDDGSKKKK